VGKGTRGVPEPKEVWSRDLNGCGSHPPDGRQGGREDNTENEDDHEDPRTGCFGQGHDLSVPEAETDWTLGDVTYSFEEDTQGWTMTSGTFTRTDTGGGANGLQSFYMASSAAEDNIT